MFDDTAKALAFDEESVKKVITNLQELRDQLPEWVEKALRHFSVCDRSITGFEGLQIAQAMWRALKDVLAVCQRPANP